MNYYPVPSIEYLKYKIMSNFQKKTKRASEELEYDQIMKDAENKQYGVSPEYEKLDYKIRTELEDLLHDVENIFAGWHSDGTAWTEWDESVRKRLMEFRIRHTYVPPQRPS
jgi:hypothetical protein